jgi:hypothetical protein
MMEDGDLGGSRFALLEDGDLGGSRFALWPNRGSYRTTS